MTDKTTLTSNEKTVPLRVYNDLKVDRDDWRSRADRLSEALARLTQPHNGEHIYAADCDACNARAVARDALSGEPPQVETGVLQPGELEQLRRIDRAARRYVDMWKPGARAPHEFHDLCNALFDGRPPAEEPSCGYLTDEGEGDRRALTSFPEKASTGHPGPQCACPTCRMAFT